MNDIESIFAEMTSRESVDTFVSTRQIDTGRLFLANLLPPVASTTDQILSGSARIVTSRGKLTGLDSPYAKVGGVRVETNSNVAFKVTAQAELSETAQRSAFAAANASNSDAIRRVVGDFIESTGPLALDYAQESFRAKLLANGLVSAKDGNVKITYGVSLPTEHVMDRSAGAGAWGAAGSTFWADVVKAADLTGQQAAAQLIVNPVGWSLITGNAAHRVRVESVVAVNDVLTKYTITRASADVTGSDIDARHRLTVWVYAGRDGDDSAENGVGEYFWPDDRASFVRTGNRQVTLIDGQVVQGALGVTHVAPNTELGMRPGRFVEVFRPQGKRFSLVTQATEFILPDIQEKRNLVIVKL